MTVLCSQFFVIFPPQQTMCLAMSCAPKAGHAALYSDSPLKNCHLIFMFLICIMFISRINFESSGPVCSSPLHTHLCTSPGGVYHLQKVSLSTSFFFSLSSGSSRGGCCFWLWWPPRSCSSSSTRPVWSLLSSRAGSNPTPPSLPPTRPGRWDFQPWVSLPFTIDWLHVGPAIAS